MFEYFNKFGFEEGCRVANAFIDHARDLYGDNLDVSVTYHPHDEVIGTNSHWIDYDRKVLHKDANPDGLNREMWHKAGDIQVYVKDKSRPSEEFGWLDFKNGRRRKEADLSFMQCQEDWPHPYGAHGGRKKHIQGQFKKQIA